MLRIFFLYFWPIFIPTVLYIAWFLYARHQQEEGKDPLKWTDGPWALMLIITLLVALLCFIPVFQYKTAQKGDHYRPAEYRDGVLVPGEVR